MLMIPNVYNNGAGDPNHKPTLKEIEPMSKFNEEMGKSVTILGLNGLQPLQKGARVAFSKGNPVTTDGPFIETKEVVGGYWHLEAKSKDEVVKWAQRCPAEPGDIIEIRQIFEASDFDLTK
jgi:hypothetical protein